MVQLDAAVVWLLPDSEADVSARRRQKRILKFSSIRVPGLKGFEELEGRWRESTGRGSTALSTEIPISSELERVCDAAKNLQYKFQQSQIEPLHLLAAVLTEESSQFTRLLREVGITYDQVLQRLRTATKD
jgi:ATP-dependent Clp protease ATP-binding subunit ClpA